MTVALRIAGAMLLAGIVAALLSAFGPRAQFVPDSYDYAIMMLQDRGVPYAAAQRDSEAFFARQPVARIPLQSRWVHGKPEYWELFSVRRLDSWLASLLYPFRGFMALVDVSRASYVITAMLVVLLAARFAPLWCGVLVSVALSLFPPWRDLGRDAFTDPLAVALATGTLATAAACVTRLSVARIALFAALCALLTLARPITYIVLGAGLVACVAAPRRTPAMTAAVWIAAVGAICCVAIEYALAQAHAPSFAWIVADTYRHFVASGYAPANESLRAFFLHEEATIGIHALVKGALSVVPLLAIAGMIVRRTDPAMPLLAGACAATWFGALVDPDRFDMIRCVVMPVAPVMAAFAAAAIADLTQVPVRLGLGSLTLRYSLPGRPPVRKATVKE